MADAAADWVGGLYDGLLADMLLRRDPEVAELDFLTSRTRDTDRQPGA